LAQELFELGYEPLPIRPGKKAPAPSRWSSVSIDAAQVDGWVRQFPKCGVGLRTGALVGLDIDCLDQDQAHEINALAHKRFGETLIRVGRWPKRLLLYRTAEPFSKMKSGQVEILGRGQQFVAFGIHPDTGRAYYWPEGQTPLDFSLSELPEIDAERAAAFLAEAMPGTQVQAARPKANRQTAQDTPERDADGTVIDGRDGWLSRLAYHAVQDALDRGEVLDAHALAAPDWEQSASSAALSRARGAPTAPYGVEDGLKKGRDKPISYTTPTQPPKFYG